MEWFVMSIASSCCNNIAHTSRHRSNQHWYGFLWNVKSLFFYRKNKVLNRHRNIAGHHITRKPTSSIYSWTIEIRLQKQKFITISTKYKLSFVFGAMLRKKFTSMSEESLVTLYMQTMGWWIMEKFCIDNLLLMFCGL